MGRDKGEKFHKRNKPQPCSTCKGSGMDKDGEDCRDCNGLGTK